MSFLNITDPKKRDAVVADYLATVKRLQQRNLNEKAQDLARNENLNEMFNPVVQSTVKSTEAITKELIPLREEVKHLNENLAAAKEKLDDSTRLSSPSSSSSDFNMLDRYFTTGKKSKVDNYFGIERTNDDRYMMGDKEVIIDQHSNINVEGVEYKGTSGLWTLVMSKTPKFNNYSADDFSRYGDLVKQTNVMLHPRNLEAQSRPTTTWKWKHILTPLQQPIKQEEKSGEGIQFLPSDIKGLTSKLQLLLGEFAAGNRSSTRNEIVFILDELLRRKSISRKEYTEINSYLSRCL